LSDEDLRDTLGVSLVADLGCTGFADGEGLI
jgi:hypothetical protein